MIKSLPEKAYSLPLERLISDLKTDPSRGLSQAEVETRRKSFGKNELQEEKQKNILLILLEQFLDPVIYMLLAAASLGFAFGEYIEAIAVLVVILITAAIGFFMEWQAIRSMEALRKMTVSHSRVLRNGKEVRVEAWELVPGDIMLLESGDVIPADARVLEHENLAVKEAALTGESVQVEKTTEVLPAEATLSERTNMIFSGTLITRGTVKALVSATGETTELGKISQMTREAKDELTPIEKKLASLSKKLIWLTLILALLIAITGYWQGRELEQMIKTAIALAVASIPEGLPIVATIALARGMLRLAKDRVIIKELRSVETLGSTGIICTDKTGTLTENEMSARSFFLSSSEELEIPEENKAGFFEGVKSNQGFFRLVETGVLCNNVQVNDELTGDPVEVALVELARLSGIDVNEVRDQHPEEVELPFDTETKMMATLNQFGEGYRLNVKGALESVLDHCDKIYLQGVEKSFENKKEWLEKADEMAARGLRTLSFAYRDFSGIPQKEEMLRNLTFLGLVGFIDPPRTDVKEAINICKRAGIRVIMVTGDHPETARSIAESVELLEKTGSAEKVFTGKQLGKVGEKDGALKQQLLDAAVFARVTPSQKLELVKFYQKNDFIVGMTGDGVNDAPALKKADIGIAMGIRGTEAAKEVADVILRDDQFTSIELAIRQGRIIFENIRNFVVYLLSSNLAEIIAVALASLSNLPLPLLPLQILFLNLVTDVFPALALGLGEGEKNIMKHPPRPLSEPIMPRKYWVSTIVYGLGITVGVLGITVFAHLHLNLDAARVNNMAFYTLVLGQLLNILNLPKRDESFLVNEVTKNPWVWGAIIFCIVITALGYIITPLREILSLVPLGWQELAWVAVFSFGSLGLSQLIKRMGLTV